MAARKSNARRARVFSVLMRSMGPEPLVDIRVAFGDDSDMDDGTPPPNTALLSDTRQMRCVKCAC